MVAPSFGRIAEGLHLDSTVKQQMAFSIFVLPYAIGSLVFEPLSEVCGRRAVLILSNFLFITSNAACAFSKSSNQLIAFRCFAGVGASAPFAIGRAVLGDLFKPKDREKPTRYLATAPLVGLILGNLVGALASSGWALSYSLLYILTSSVGVILLVRMFWLQESYAPLVLQRQLRLRAKDESLRREREAIVTQSVARNFLEFPFGVLVMAFTQPLVLVISLLISTWIGTVMFLLSPLSMVFDKTTTLANFCLAHVSTGVGLLLGAIIWGRIDQGIYRKLRSRDPRRQGRPEYRAVSTLPFFLLSPVGLAMVGWSLDKGGHWVFVNIGLFFFAFSTISIFRFGATYLIEVYERFASLAIAAVTIFSSVTGFAFPMLSATGFGYGWGCTGLAVFLTVIGLWVLLSLWIVGERFRKVSSFTAKGAQASNFDPSAEGYALLGSSTGLYEEGSSSRLDGEGEEVGLGPQSNSITLLPLKRRPSWREGGLE